MAPLAARDVEHPGAVGKGKDGEEPRRLLPVALEREDRVVLEQVMSVEVRLPPVGGRRGARPLIQKNTGSRYAPNTSSIAARISNRVQYARAQSRI